MTLNPVIYNDEEQKAAEAEIQTQAQINANQNMLLQNARKGQEFINGGAADRLQEGFDLVQAKAKAARPTTETPPPAPAVKKSRWSWLTGK